MKVVTINIRGLGVEVKWKYLCELRTTEKPSVMCV